MHEKSITLEQQTTCLVSESEQVFDGVDLQNGVHRRWFCLQVGKHVVGEEFDYVDEGVDGSDSLLRLLIMSALCWGGVWRTYVQSRSARGDRCQKVNGGILGLPVFRRIRRVLLEQKHKQR